MDFKTVDWKGVNLMSLAQDGRRGGLFCSCIVIIIHLLNCAPRTESPWSEEARRL